MPRLAIVAIVIAGFFLTGDIPAVMEGGRRLATAAVNLKGRLVDGWQTPAQTTDRPLPGPGKPSQPPRPLIPPAAVSRVQIDQLQPGDRLLLWCGHPGGIELLAIDVIDPGSGEGLLFRHLDATADLSQSATATPGTPRRIVVDPLVVQRSVAIRIKPVGSELAVRLASRRSGPPLSRIGPVVAVLAVHR